ncbi:MAG: NADH-quinone oxidoreductase subunit N [Armatimonadota bacterium]|nr:NADH-quinone oxidoreductase subunit N [Armatimonadota bacterium]MDR7451870.1 NADH-quinone oxidoreductase subunit N [Armatimonadota bacterium]MDR7467595.1 NADH-quinone oxidoreductase subunit N [Armatimonadota bacterium]MDR7494444.1 NADH-quinone oxidoreductase subunit N [Armatimonadota bacterium]MDR7499705.1 NADH-quinone oxidoreductase subunit N [Armatimonadota bacterium]
MTPAAAEVRALTPELIVAGATLLVMVWATFLPSHRQGSLRWAAAGALGAALWATFSLDSGQPSLFGGMYGRDPLTMVFQVAALLAALLALALGAAYVERTRLAAGEFYALVLTAALGAMVMAGSTDLIMVFLGLETLSIPLYVLAGFARTDLRSQEAGMKYFLLGAFSTAIFLYGIALVYGATGSTALVRLAAAPAPPLLLDAGVGLLLIGLAFKAALVPFHGWAPDVYEGAPLPVTAYMSVIAKVGAFAALLRVFPPPVGSEARWAGVLALLSLLTMALANLAALRQTNLKRLLAYSSISHAGFILIGVAAGTDQGARAAVFYLLVYAFMTLGAFAVALQVARRSGEADQIADLAGLASRSPALAAAMTVFMVSLAGIPPTAGFIGKLYVFTAALDAGQPVLAVVGVLASVVSAYFYLRVAYTMFTGEPRGEVTLTGDRWLTAALLVTVAATLALGVFPAPLTALVQQMGQALR